VNAKSCACTSGDHIALNSVITTQSLPLCVDRYFAPLLTSTHLPVVKPKMLKPNYRKLHSKLPLNYDLDVGTPKTGVFASAPGTANTTSSTLQPAQPAHAPPEPSILDLTFEEHKNANLNIDEQHGLIGQIRDETPAEDLEYIDALMLGKLAKQLDMCIFPMCKMMHIDKNAVWKMLEQQFKKTYPPTEEEEDAAMESVAAREVTVVLAAVHTGETAAEAGVIGTTEIEVTGIQAILNNAASTIKASTPPAATPEPINEKFSMIEKRARSGTVESERSVHPLEPAKKKIKKEPLSQAQKEIRAYQAKKKRGHRKCYMFTLKSSAVAEKWAELTEGV